MATPSEINHILKVLAAAYPTFALTAPTGLLYVELLQDLPGKLLHAAALEHIGRSSFFPTVAELRQAAQALLPPQAGGPPDAHRAWTEVLRAFDEVGAWGQPAFSDPLIDAAVQALDWPALCRSDNPISDRSHFVQVYQALLERRQAELNRPAAVQAKLLQAGVIQPQIASG